MSEEIISRLEEAIETFRKILQDLVKSGNVEIFQKYAPDIMEYVLQDPILLYTAALSGDISMVKYVFSLTSRKHGDPTEWKREFMLKAVEGGNMECIEFALAQQDVPVWKYEITWNVCRYAPLQALKILRKGLVFQRRSFCVPWAYDTIEGLALRKKTEDVKEFLDYIYGDMKDPEPAIWRSPSTFLAAQKENIPFLEYARDNQQRITEVLKEYGMEIFWHPRALEAACESGNVQVLKLVYEASGQKWSDMGGEYDEDPMGDYLFYRGSVECLIYAVEQGYIVPSYALQDIRDFHKNCHVKCHHPAIYQWIVHNIYPGQDLPPLL